MAKAQETGASPRKGRRWLWRAVLLVILGPIVVWNFRHATQLQPTGVVSDLRTIRTALITYASSFNNGFPASLEALGPNLEGEDNCEAAGMLGPDLAVAEPQRHGYNYFYRPAGERLSEPEPGCSQGGYLGYTLSARPLRYRPGWWRPEWSSYFTDETGVIRWTNEDRAATAEDPRR
ncbi:hypothetical protein MYX77_07800 [Acidobacteriia bacterium AH_259_A11_L15]|nr:hypothetical protein [Acidobacteriia bacterium AH_259_A11_L15]